MECPLQGSQGQSVDPQLYELHLEQSSVAVVVGVSVTGVSVTVGIGVSVTGVSVGVGGGVASGVEVTVSQGG